MSTPTMKFGLTACRILWLVLWMVASASAGNAHAQTLAQTQIEAAETEVEPGAALPELGDSSSRFLSPAEAAQIGLEFQRRLLRSREYIDDPELRAYLNRLGQRVARFADLRDLTPEFNLIVDSRLNAFAVPGGFITFHSGLVLHTESESELASVLGHEIAHLAQRHLPRLLAKAESNRLPATAAILASILVGGQAGLAGLTATNAQLVSNRLAYTREFEAEADALGIRYLVEAGFDPTAMPGFFHKMERYARTQSEQIREFLQTHPLPHTRIAEAEARAADYAAVASTNSIDYLLAKAKLHAMYTELSKLDKAKADFTTQIAAAQGSAADAARYGLSLVLLRQRAFDAAQELIDPLLRSRPRNIALQIAKSKLDAAAGRTAAAAARLESLRQRHPDKAYLTFYLADALLADQQAAAAKQVVRYQLRRQPQNFRLYQPLSKANVAMGNLAEAHQADAEYLAALGDYAAAADSLKLALRDTQSGTYLHQSLAARLKQVQALQQQAD